MAEANARLKFLWAASHSLLATCPAVSSRLMAQFLAQASDRDLRLHEDIQAKACAGCGSIFAPGLNTRVRIVPSQEKLVEKQRRGKKRQQQQGQQQQQQRSKTANSDLPRDGGVSTDQEDENNMDVDTVAKGTGEDVPSDKTSGVTGQQEGQSESLSKTKSKVIRLVPWTELHREEARRQHLKQQQKQRLRGMAPPPLAEKERHAKARAKREMKKQKKQLNHLHYTCLRCHRVTEMPGATREQLGGLLKQTKPKKKRDNPQLQAKTNVPPLPTHQPQQQVQSPSSLPLSASIPPKPSAASNLPKPATPPSRAGSTFSTGTVKSATSASSSPAGTPPPSTPPSGGGGEKSNRKKKKNNLSSLLANQRSRDNPPSSTPPSAGSSDSVLASFLAGL
ncbi:hypothetical protein DFQ27_008672 [Actinomortierella ambigua]|uniref:Uncharacterized protein n=1 Tax=Actinomortierella ambigua TaxID=1343610 RepID=A0A9P6QJG4_9FUNG|nr:hypothetical protein DFQ27_008672 [Actinomortierella ambigua]